MTPSITRHWILSKKPTDLPILSGPDSTFSLATKPLPPVEDGQVMIKVLYLSNDPAQRLWIDPSIAPDRLYIEPVEVGDTMASYTCICEIIESKATDLTIGALILADVGWSEYAVLPAENCIPINPIKGLKPVHYVSLFGVAGVTAYYGLVDIARTTANDAVVISGAAGAVGSIAVQIAKNVLGCKRVIGIAGTDAKCRWVESLGADICLNYTSKDFEVALKEATDGFVEVFFDNVGGEILDLMLTRVKKDGRIAACGAIAEYNGGERSGIKKWYHVIAMRLQIRGFVVLDAIPTGRWTAIVEALVQGFQDRKIKATDEGLTIRQSSFEDVPKTWMGLFDGRNSGKLLTQLL
ncbi:NAD(P)-binding protein [Eremomyces bilateralis CBS 781.70]|uniref:NAD(P)-binding protein n=1 Tax=Eremomyces bilateralis CBS 781.70 TaxID=1392243 RepID=A0A6G1FVL3_9PEZI|nr:NAD(P)-binding protein [Eremomyces bilateralis CBS 781.70]KAF1809824.1 NAD(P)-binding protein [Eremomyces bilateralis CBS 781.70]